MKRRVFLKTTMTGVGALAGLPLVSRGTEVMSEQAEAAEGIQLPTDGFQMPDWFRYARAVYFDGYSPPIYPRMKEFNAQRLIDGVVELKGNLLRFQPIGYWAYYQSKVLPMHPELGTRDLIDEVSRECRRSNIHQYCYAQYGAPFMEVGWVDRNPQYDDWVLRDPNGKPYGKWWHLGWRLLQYLCVTGETYRGAIRKIVQELCEHDIDGVYFDAPSGYRGVCFCESCRRNFNKFSGMDLEQLVWVVKYGGDGVPLRLDWNQVPESVDLKPLITWYAWVNKLAQEDLMDFRKIIHGSGKLMLCHNGLTWDGSSVPLQYRIPDGFMVEASAETWELLGTGMLGGAMARPHGKIAQMYLGGYSVGTPPQSRPSVVHNTDMEDTDEVRMQGFANLACGNAPIYATANRLYFGIGSGSVKPAQEVFEFMRGVEEIHRDSVPVPYVTIVPTWESLQLWQTRSNSLNWPVMSQAFALVMLDERISVEVNPSTEVSDEWLERQHVIALCGASGISNTETERLARWVERGGGLLATYDTGLYDHKGRLRGDGGALKEVLGVDIKGKPLISQPECYYRVRRTHPALAQLGPGAVVLGDGRVVPVEPRDGALVLADCWNLGTDEVRGPAIIANNYGKGRTIYISGSLEAHYAASRVPAVRRLLGSIVSYLGGGRPLPFHLSAPRGVYAVLRRAPNEDLVLWVLANVGFKDASIGVMRQDYVPVSDVEIRIRVPERRQAKGMRLMRSGQSLPYRLENGYAVATVAKLHIAEVVHLQLA